METVGSVISLEFSVRQLVVVSCSLKIITRAHTDMQLTYKCLLAVLNL